VKTCNKCTETKPLAEFFMNRGKPMARCKLCSRGTKSSRYFVGIKFTYGLTRENWDALLCSQDGLCDVCDTELVDPCIDHCHSSGKVRGMLCRLCNIAAGALHDSPTIANQLTNYLGKHYE